MLKKALRLVSDPRWKAWVQPLFFSAIGVLNTVTDYIVFLLLLNASVHIAAANVMSYSCGAAVSYVLNKNITFRGTGNQSNSGQSLSMFIVLTVVMIIVSTIATIGFALFVEPPIAKLLSVLVVATLSFLGMKYVVFGPEKAGK